MNLFFDKIFNIPVTHVPTNDFGARVSFMGKKKTDNDTFVKSSKTPATEATAPVKKKRRRDTEKGDVLKKLDNITCPYSGVKLISCKKWDSEIQPKLQEARTFDEKMDILETYEPNMQKLERQIFGIFKDYRRKHPGSGSFNDCLKEMRPECLMKLRNDEFRVLNEVDSLAEKLNDYKLEYEIKLLTTDARIKIKADKQDNIFKRKDILNPLKDKLKGYTDQELATEIWEKANELPKAKTNINAFVVKYAYRNPEVIAERILYPSISSIEHIRPLNPDSPDIESGENEMTNFMLAANDWNSGRGCQALPKFVVNHPNIPKYSQRHINDIIRAIHNNELKGYDWYPYVLKEKLYNESDGLINVNVDKYKISEADALKEAPQKVKRKYRDLIEANKEIKPMTIEEYKSAKNLS